MAAPEDFKRYQNPERLDWVKDEFQKIRDELREVRRGTAARGTFDINTGITHEMVTFIGLTDYYTEGIELTVPAGYSNGAVSGSFVVNVWNQGAIPVTVYLSEPSITGHYIATTLSATIAPGEYGLLAVPFAWEIEFSDWADHVIKANFRFHASTDSATTFTNIYSALSTIFQQ